MFEITDSPITVPYSFKNSHIGGVVDFIGRVRSINDGKEVQSLEYEAYDALAKSEGQKIIREALEKFDILDAYAIHRAGHLDIGDTAVYVSTGAIHRKTAFKATQYIIDEIKKRVPIWKREYYADGTKEWVACHHCAHVHQENTHAAE